MLQFLISKYVRTELWSVLYHPCSNFKSSLAIPPSKEWAITSHKAMTCDYISVTWFQMTSARKNSSLILVNVHHVLKSAHMMTSPNGNIFHVTGPLWGGIHLSPVDSPHNDQWRVALMFSLMHAWTNSGAQSRYAGDLRRRSAHFDVTLMNIRDYCVVGSGSI